ncbi:acyltransferase family protein [Marinobacter sp. M-5]|uniref:acyltransferase family protein n=1 Tax=Marinobacter sp. M-5 TaxID=3081089 RepID=UPI00293D1577|nr:acyltransferase family protein [Marinobacter sp. M-5]MDV3503101.1 acyltransferase family protein [Marinobacter sp. M-5]
MQYRREIDGLRAMAVLPVILFHAGFSWFSGGYVGVDVFFVISGYLITNILISEMSEGNFSIAKFYERRARRILPALFFVMICCVPFAWLWMVPQELKNFYQSFVAISFFASNVLFWRKSGYFAPAAEENPLLHTWSLAVEEQFYIFFPLLLLMLWRFGKKPIFYVIIGLSFLSFLLSEYGWRNHPTANFYLLPTRAWELGVGAICAFLMFQRSPKPNSMAASTGLALIAYSIFFFDETTPFPSVYALAPVLGTALIILYSHEQNLVNRILASRILVGIGLISFSAYLWHQPLLAFARIRSASEPGWVLMFGLSIASLTLALITWKYIEQPFRTRELSFTRSRKQIFSYAAIGTVIFTTSGLYGHFNSGLPDRVAPSGVPFSEINIAERIKVNHGLDSECEGTFTTSEKCRTGPDPRVMLWGDSFAMHLAQAVLASPSLEGKNLIQFTKSVCSPILGVALTNRKYPEAWSRSCVSFNDQVRDWLKNDNDIEYVIMSSPLGILFNEIYDATGARRPASEEVVLAAMNETAAFVESLGKKPVFVSPPPRTGENLSKCSTYNLIFEGNEVFDCAFTVAELSEQHIAVMTFLARPDLALPVLDLGQYICDRGKCPTLVDGINIYRDVGHLSDQGSELIGLRYDLLGSVQQLADQSQDVPNAGSGLAGAGP